MKKIFNKVMLIVLCFTLSVMCVPNKPEEIVALEDVIDVDNIDLDFEVKQLESIEQYRDILDSFNEQEKARISGEQIYDDNFGGAYIDDEGELVVLLVEEEPSDVNQIKLAANAEVLQTQDCEYSYNELLYVINNINDNLEYLYENGIIISEMYEDVYENRVYIGVDELTDDKRDVIRNIVDSGCMYIYNKYLQSEEMAGVDVKGGMEISSSLGSSTVGFCAKRNGVEGFVVAGHAVGSAGDTVYVSNTQLGTVVATAYYNNSNADAAFVRKSTNVNTIEMIHGYKCRYVATDIAYYPVGTRVYKFGKTTQQTQGEVLNNYYTSYASNLYFTNQTTTSFKVEPGDSGGPVFTIGTVVNGHITCRLLGIVRARYKEYGQSGYKAIFSKYEYIVDELDATAMLAQ